jgi:hypothetical protein
LKTKRIGGFMDLPNGPDYRKLLFVPVWITLAITLLRLLAEFMNLPSWLANKNVGGFGAIIGISWLPPILGVYFARKLRDISGKLWWNLFKTLLLYGLAARIPVILIMGVAICGNWHTHYNAFASGLAHATPMAQFVHGAVMPQLIWWILIWTLGTGMLTGLVASLFWPRPKTQ